MLSHKHISVNLFGFEHQMVVPWGGLPGAGKPEREWFVGRQVIRAFQEPWHVLAAVKDGSWGHRRILTMNLSCNCTTCFVHSGEKKGASQGPRGHPIRSVSMSTAFPERRLRCPLEQAGGRAKRQKGACHFQTCLKAPYFDFEISPILNCSKS